MITRIQAIAVGNALRLFLSPPASAEYWRVLRRTSDSFSGPDDAGAFKVHEGTDEVIQDYTALANDTEYFYRAWWWDGAAWVDAGVLSGTPAVTLQDESVDVLSLLQDRISVGLAVEVGAARLFHEEGKIACRPAPVQLDHGVVLPVVTVQLIHDVPGERFVGEQMLDDDRIEDGYKEYEGWYSRVQADVVAWTFNPEERIALRKALKRIVVGNLPIFHDAGLLQVEFDIRDAEDYESFGAMMYQAWGTFRCLAPSMVSGEVGEIADVVTEITWG